MKPVVLVVFLMLCSLASSADDFPFRPWTPPSLKDRSVSVWGRTYGYGNSLLPTSVITQADDILAGPMQLAAAVDGKKADWSVPVFKQLASSPESAAYQVEASSGAIWAVCTYRTEFDGVTKVDLTLRSKTEVRIDSLDIIVPLKPRYCKLFHHSSTYPVYIWDWPKRRINSGKVDEESMSLPFVFHIWLGDDERGLQIFSESDQALQPADPEKTVAVSPGKDRSVLKFNLLSGFKLDGEWKWSFGFVATPVKPYPKDYLDVRYCQMGGFNIEKNQFGDVPADSDHPPYIDYLSGLGTNWIGFHESWSREQSLPRPDKAAELKSLIAACHKRGIGFATYTGCWMSTKSPEYRADWDMLPLAEHYQYQRPDTGDICRAVCNNTGWPDLLVSTYTRAFREWGIDGLYMDGFTCPLACTNVKHGCGYGGRDGKVHPTMPIWKTREAMKSLYRLVKGQKKPGVIVSHTSGSILLPALSFADMYLDGEHLTSFMKPGTPEYPEEILRAEMSGHNFGIPGTHLPTGGDKAEFERARTIFALHDIRLLWHPEHQADLWKAFRSFDVTGAQWVPYWRSAGLIKSDDRDNIKISAYLVKGRGALFVVANLGSAPAASTLTFDLEGLGLKPGSALHIKDESSGPQLQFQNRETTLSVDPGTFKLVSIKDR